ncbi:MAG: GAF domain-containing protein [Chloroflexi bacterium]|nr:GAF domain-containing protein [Chloroflexota bacterium]
MIAALLARTGLSFRLMLGVGAGFLALFLAMGFLAMQALEESGRIILEERQARASMAAEEMDRFIAQAFYELERATDFAPFDPTARLLDAEHHMLAHAYGRLGSFSRGVSFLDRNGRIVMTEPAAPELLGMDLSQQPHIREALETGRRSVSPPHLNVREGRPVVALAVPVKDASGRVISLLSGLVDLADSPIGHALITATTRGTTFHADVVATDGTVVMSTSPEHVLQPGEHLEFYLRAFAEGKRTIETVPYIEHGVVEGQHVMAFQLLRNAPWGLSLGADEGETFAPVNDFRRTLVMAGLLFFLAVLSLTLAGAQLMVRPVQALTEAAQRMAGGDLSQRIGVTEGGEIGALATSLETMRQRLDGSISEITQLNATLEQRVEARTLELAERNQEMAATAALAERINASLDLEEVLRSGLEGVLDVVKADGGAIWLSQQPTGDLRMRVHKNLPEEFLVAESRLACGDCLCGLIAAQAQPILIHDLVTNPLAIRDACRHTGFTRLIGAPLISKGTVRGVFMLGAAGGAFDEHDARLVTAVAHHLSVAVENATLYEELQQQEAHLRHLLERMIGVQEAERKRIARELHDETGQALTALIMTLESTADGLSPAQEVIRGRLGRAKDMLRATLEDIRKIILDLRPTALDDLGLVAALRRYAEAHLEPLGVTSQIVASGYQDGLWPETEVVLFRIGQEAINNVARHSGARNVRIEVRRAADGVELDVEDDGKGFDWQELERADDPMKGLGLMGMQERASFFGGSCRVISQPGQGTQVHVSVPSMEGAGVRSG